MAKIKILHDTVGETLTIYFHEPQKHQVCEQLDDGMILIKDEKTNQVIGFEKINYKPKHSESLIIESEAYS